MTNIPEGFKMTEFGSLLEEWEVKRSVFRPVLRPKPIRGMLFFDKGYVVLDRESNL